MSKPNGRNDRRVPRNFLREMEELGVEYRSMVEITEPPPRSDGKSLFPGFRLKAEIRDTMRDAIVKFSETRELDEVRLAVDRARGAVNAIWLTAVAYARGWLEGRAKSLRNKIASSGRYPKLEERLGDVLTELGSLIGRSYDSRNLETLKPIGLAFSRAIEVALEVKEKFHEAEANRLRSEEEARRRQAEERDLEARQKLGRNLLSLFNDDEREAVVESAAD